MMIVLRSTYEREREARIRAEAEQAVWQHRAAMLHQQYADALRQMLAMKREGFATPPVLSEREQEPSLPQAIRAAIDTVAEPNSREHGDAVALARRLMQGQEQTPENVNLVVERILRGGKGPEMGG